MARTVQRQSQVSEDLFPGPGARILFPTIGEPGQGLGLLDLAEGLDKESVFAGEVFLRQQHLAALISRSSHNLNQGAGSKAD